MSIFINGVEPPTLSQFPAGEPLVIFENPSLTASIFVQGHSPLQFLQLCGILDVFRDRGWSPQLVMPYFPGGRQDRREGTPLTVKVYADIINSYEVKEVVTYDNHSDVTGAVLNRNVNVPMTRVFSRISTGHLHGVIAPDAGASRKVRALANQETLSFDQGGKHRDPSTGKLSGFMAPKALGSGEWLVVDDICDGGGTFIGFAEQFKRINPTSSLSLYVTHGIFSKGLDDLFTHYETITTTNSFEQSDDRLTVIDLRSLT